MARYRRVELDRGERWTAGVVSLAVGAAVGAVSFYLTRLMLSREELPTGPVGLVPPRDPPATPGRALPPPVREGR